MKLFDVKSLWVEADRNLSAGEKGSWRVMGQLKTGNKPWVLGQASSRRDAQEQVLLMLGLLGHDEWRIWFEEAP